jgi:hypothetical protein
MPPKVAEKPEVFSRIPQWVLSVPHALRYRIAYDPALLARLMRIFSRAVFQSLRRRAAEFGIPRGQCGAVTFVQRFGSALNLHPHGHMVVLDGVYAALPGEAPRFYPLAAPEQKDVVGVAQAVAAKVQALLEAEGSTGEAVTDEPWLAGLYTAGVNGRVGTGPRARQRIEMAYGEEEDPERQGSRCCNVGGFSVHANVAVRAGDRKGLEALCKYAARPPLAHERLQESANGKLLYRMKTPWRNGATHVVMDRIELLEKLAALVPRPRYHVIHYYGVLAPAAKWRPQIVPDAESKSCAHIPQEEARPQRKRNYTWAQLMARTFALDVLECPRCQGRMKIVTAIESPEIAGKILDSLGISCRPPPVAPARHRTDTLGDF